MKASINGRCFILSIRPNILSIRPKVLIVQKECVKVNMKREMRIIISVKKELQKMALFQYNSLDRQTDRQLILSYLHTVF